MNKISKILISLICFLMINSFGIAFAERQEPFSNSNVVESVEIQDFGGNSFEQIDTVVIPEGDTTVLNQEIKQQTKPKKSMTNIILKFLFAMLWVVISSIFVFLILLAYKKLILKYKSVTPTYESLEHSLDTPKNFKEALKIFLDKTKWN